MKALDNPVTYYMPVEVGKIKDMHMLACMNTHRHTHSSSHLPAFFPLLCTKKPRGQVWFISHSRTVGFSSTSVSEYSNTVQASPQVLAVVI